MSAIIAGYTKDTVTVYQAYPAAIAEAALAAGTFVSPFRPGRMTWIKPSFLWMMYRSGWAAKPGQERILSIKIGIDDLTWALEHACLSAYDPKIHRTRQEWSAELAVSQVRVQWDPGRDLNLRATSYRTIQIGLGHQASHYYVNSWIRELDDVTELAHEVGGHVRSGDLNAAQSLLPDERPLAVGSQPRIGLDM